MTALKRPSALIPLAMSLAALQTDEGAAAHTWQLLMAGQVPFIAYFAATWLPRAPLQAAIVLGLHLVAAVAAAAPVFLLRL